MKRRTVLIASSAAALAAALGIGAYVWRPGGQSAIERAVIDQGRRLYAVHCAACHGANLEGQPNWQQRLPNGRLPAPPHDASGHTWHHPDDVLLQMTRDGVSSILPGYESDMPAFAGILTDDEIRAVLAFIRSTWPERERNYRAQRSRVNR